MNVVVIINQELGYKRDITKIGATVNYRNDSFINSSWKVCFRKNQASLKTYYKSQIDICYLIQINSSGLYLIPKANNNCYLVYKLTQNENENGTSSCAGPKMSLVAGYYWNASDPP